MFSCMKPRLMAGDCKQRPQLPTAPSATTTSPPSKKFCILRYKREAVAWWKSTVVLSTPVKEKARRPLYKATVISTTTHREREKV